MNTTTARARCPGILTSLWLGFLLWGGSLLAQGDSLAQDASRAPGGAYHWPHWRGPERDGVSRETGWESQGKEAWKKNVGRGYSCASIQDGRLYTLGFDTEREQDVLVCLDADTGDEIWRQSWPAKIWAKYHGGGTLTTPTVHEDRVYVTNREGRFLCFAAETGRSHWSRQLEEEHALEVPEWGFAAAPLVLDDRVFVNMGRVLAFDRQTGELRWKSNDCGDAYSTPTPFELAGVPVLAVFNGGGLVILDRGDGEEICRQEWDTKYDVNAATPVLVDEDLVFISSGYNRGCAMVRVDIEGAEIAWESKVMRNHMAGCTLFDGHLYGFDEAVLKCIDLEGQERWHARGLGKGAHAVADGKLLVLTSSGELIVAEASAAGFQELSREKVLEGGECWTTPVLANGRIYCRNSKGDLVCRDHRPHAPPR